MTVRATVSLAALLASSASALQQYAFLALSQATAPCLRESYYGAYGGQAQTHIYLPSAECLDHPETYAHQGFGAIAPFDLEMDEGRLIWVGQAGVEGVTNDMPAAWTYLLSTVSEYVAQLELVPPPFEQVVLGGRTRKILDPGKTVPRLIYQSPWSMLLHVPDHLLPLLDTFLPPHLVPVALPTEPLEVSALDAELSNDWGVPEKYAENLANLTKHLVFDPALDKVVSTISMDNVRRHVRWLTGEAPSGIESRHSFTEGAVKTAHWIKKHVEDAGATCKLMHYMTGFSPNVLCEFPNNSSEHIILSAHYDSRGSFGNTRAPGGDDDGSGTGHLLAVVDAIKENKVLFDKAVIVAFFSGEEQGLYGSRAFAKHLKDENVTVLLQVQADMLGYHAPGEPMQLGMPASIHLPEASYLIGNLSHLYSPELLVGSTEACCSDHQSFLQLGYPSTQVFERNGWIADPFYHNSGDLSLREGYDFDQIVAIARVTMSGIMSVAGWSQGA